jgi:TANFOR domain-containing protein
MKKTSIIFILFLVCGITEAQVMVQVQVLPPYSTYLPDYFNYENRVVLTLISMNGQTNVKLSATIHGDNGISVSSNPQYMPPVPIHLDHNVMVSLTGGDLQNYFDYNSAVVTGIDKNTLFHGSGIPEGVYTLCIRALDYATGAPLSDPSPAGCSNPFEVKYVDPPVLISPSCGDSISSDNQQSIVFSWVPSQGTPATTQYKFKMVELIPPDRNPNDAMNSATTPPFYETTVNSLVFVYGPSEPFLQPGHSYAWRVTAVDAYSVQLNSTGALQYVNNGNSEVCWFNEKTGVQPVNQVSCDCYCSPAIYPVLKQGNKRTYDVGGVFSCTGLCPAGGGDATACVIVLPPSTYKWHIGAGNDVVTSIVGPDNGKTVELKINGKGDYNLYVSVTLNCSCNISCTGVAGLEQSVIDFPPPTGCLCEIQSEIIGGEPIKVVNPLAAYIKPMIKEDGKPAKNQTLAVGLSVLATDNDDLIHRCILGGKREKLIEHVGDRVSYSWTLEKGSGVKIIGEKQGTAMLILPYDIKPKDILEYRIKCTISSNADEDLTGYVNVKVSGADTCEFIKIDTTVEAMSRGTKKTPELSKAGECVPDENATWKKADPISATLKIPAFVPVGELTHIGLDAFDSDRLTISCESKREGCGNPEKTIEIFEGLKFDWSDGGAGGTFVPVTDGNGALYRAPDKAGEVTITCKINDAGNHRTASGEEVKVSGKIKVVDVMRALFMGLEPDSSKQQFLTVGPDTRLWPVFIKQPVPELLKSDWCLDLGGHEGMMKASLSKGKAVLKPGDLILRIQEAKEKDYALFVHWRNHHHIHDKHALICKTTYRFPGNEIPYIDGDWKKSNFLEGEVLDTFKLFFNLYTDDLTKVKDPDSPIKLDKVGKLDDGKWRGIIKNDDDIYGEETSLNGDKNIANFLLHWAQETYDPSKYMCSLKREDPKIVYRSSFEAADKTKPTAEYRWNASTEGEGSIPLPANILLVSDKAIQPSKRDAHTYSRKPSISSDMTEIKTDVTLPKIDIIGIESAIRCINHELAHWEAIKDNWKEGGAWQKLYGNHTVFKTWQDVNDGNTVVLKQMKHQKDYKNVRKYFNAAPRINDDPASFTVQGGNQSLEVSAIPIPGQPGIYNFTLKFKKVFSGNRKPIDTVILKIPGGWLVDGNLNGDFTLYSQNIKGIELRRVMMDQNPPATEVHKSPGEIQNGVVVIRDKLDIWVYERHNDIDGDWIPNAVEDEMGTDWLKSGTYKGNYHLIPNDQEFWAEWRIRKFFNEKTGKMNDTMYDKKKDWANPGLQTEIEKK